MLPASKTDFAPLPARKRRAFVPLIVIGFVVAVLAIVGMLVYNQRFRFMGSTPDQSAVGLETIVILRFNRPLDRSKTDTSKFTIKPSSNVNFVVDQDTVAIIPLESYEDTEYQINLPNLVSTDGDKISNFSYRFRPDPNLVLSNEESSIDLDDIATKQYPQLENVKDGEDYNIEYSFDGKTVIFDLYLIEPLSVNEDQAIDNLKKTNQEARRYIQSLNIPPDNYIIRYQNSTQEILLYGESVAPTN